MVPLPDSGSIRNLRSEGYLLEPKVGINPSWMVTAPARPHQPHRGEQASVNLYPFVLHVPIDGRSPRRHPGGPTRPIRLE